MDYSDQYLQSALPKRDPPAALVPASVQAENERLTNTQSGDNLELVRRSRSWTYAMFSELQLSQWTLKPNSPDNLERCTALFDGLLERGAIGLFDKLAEDSAFGLILTSRVQLRRKAEKIGDIFFPRLCESFPVWLRYGEITLQNPPNPANATASSWAKCRTYQNWGILTAGHAVAGLAPGGTVIFKPNPAPISGQLSRSSFPVIDAAFISAPLPPRSKAPRPLPSMQFPTAGQTVNISLQSGAVTRHIVATMNTLGVLRTTSFAVLSYIDQAFNPGDSGALVCDGLPSAAGIYLGSMTTQQAPGGSVGLVQNFEQAVYALNVDPYL